MHHDMLLMYIMRAISADTSHPLLAHLFHLHALVLRHLARVLSALGCPRTIPRQTESDMHIVQLSHLILHASVWHAYCTAITPHSACPRLTCPACFSSTSHPLRSLFNPQARLTQGGQRLGSECQHRVCTLLQHMVWHNLVSESGCRDRQRLACTIVCYYTSLCVPVFQIRHNRQGGTYCSLCIRAGARRQCSRSHRRCSPPSTSHLFAQACSACDATDRVRRIMVMGGG